jgi:hypothetical protein
LTARELDLMARARFKNDWLHTSNIMAILAEANRNPKRRRKPYSWKDFHPLYMPKKNDPSRRVSISEVLVAWGLKQEQDNGR